MWCIPVRPAVAAVLSLTLAACAGGEDGEDTGVLPEVPIFEGTIDLEIGRLDGDDPYLFSYIMDVAADERGRVLVADRQTNEVRVFEPDGDFAFRFGGPGEGPGEMTDPNGLQFGPEGELWVRESVRYSVFTLGPAEAEFQRVLRSLTPGHIGARDPFTFDAEGRLVAVGPVRGDDDVSLEARLRLRHDGVVDTMVMADSERQSVSQTTVPFSRAGISGFIGRPQRAAAVPHVGHRDRGADHSARPDRRSAGSGTDGPGAAQPVSDGVSRRPRGLVPNRETRGPPVRRGPPGTLRDRAWRDRPLLPPTRGAQAGGHRPCGPRPSADAPDPRPSALASPERPSDRRTRCAPGDPPPETGVRAPAG